MKAAILEKVKSISIKKIPIPKISDDEVLIKIKHVGICSSDIHYYNEGKIGKQIVKKPMILGHESSGIIEETGKNVKNLKIGDRVAIEPGVPCNKCDYCRIGKYNLCKNMIFLATPPIDGAFAEYLSYSKDYVYKIDDSISLTDAALIEPISVAYDAMTKTNSMPGDIVLIMGAGPIGLFSLEMAKIVGISKIIISDINEYRLDIAKQHGAFRAINIQKESLPDAVADFTKNEGADVVVETTGSSQSIENSVNIVKKGGKIVWVGLGIETVNIPYIKVIHSNLIIEGLRRYCNTYKPIIRLLAVRQINTDGIITHRFNFNEIVKAFDMAAKPEKDFMKIMIDF